uniref:Uncharacterized protein n=1 Tax=biofilter metagenome TaxID=1070537 RepID=A0A193SBQ6_9ZZZZ
MVNETRFEEVLAIFVSAMALVLLMYRLCILAVALGGNDDT